MTKIFSVFKICFILFVLLCISFLFIHNGSKPTQQAIFTSKWMQKYSEIKYMFSVIKSQTDEPNNVTRENFKEIIKTHTRMVKPLDADKVYEPCLKNKKVLSPESEYYIKDFYINTNNEITGFKWINNKCKGSELCAVMTFDINGLEPPNTFGRDIFGINIFANRVSAFGEDIDIKTMSNECKNTGVYCSYYYLVGGHFE